MRGKSTTAFDAASAKDFAGAAKAADRETQPYAKKIAHRGIWVEPSLLAEIEYRAKSVEGKVRHPFFKGNPEGFMNWGVALMWGTVIVAVLLGLLAAAYFLFQNFVFG